MNTISKLGGCLILLALFTSMTSAGIIKEPIISPLIIGLKDINAFNNLQAKGNYLCSSTQCFNINDIGAAGSGDSNITWTDINDLFVPYQGAKKDVNLGNNDLNLDNGLGDSPSIYLKASSSRLGQILQTGTSAGNMQYYTNGLHQFFSDNVISFQMGDTTAGAMAKCYTDLNLQNKDLNAQTIQANNFRSTEARVAPLGQGSVALGWDTNATGKGSFADGNGSAAMGINSFAFGSNSIASSNNSVAIGQAAKAISGLNTKAICTNCKATGGDATAFGTGTTASGQYSTATGTDTLASGARSFTANQSTQATGTSSAAFGQYCVASGQGSFAAGLNANPTRERSFALGNGASVGGDGNNGVAIGYKARVDSNNGVAIGYGARTNAPNITTIAWDVNMPGCLTVGNGKDMNVGCNDGDGNFSGNLYSTDGNMYAQNFIDLTPAFPGTSKQALDQLTVTKSSGAKIDHSSLPDFTKGTTVIKDYVKTGEECKFELQKHKWCGDDNDLCDANWETTSVRVCKPIMTLLPVGEIEGRNIGATVTMLVEAVKALKTELCTIKPESELCK